MATGTGKPKPTTSSEGEFFDHMATKRPELVEPLRRFLGEAGEIGISPEIGKTAKLLMMLSPDTMATAGHIESNGKFWGQGAAAAAIRLGQPEAGEEYLGAIAKLAGGRIRRYEKSAPEVVDPAGRGIDVAMLLAHLGEWKRNIAVLRAQLGVAVEP